VNIISQTKKILAALAQQNVALGKGIDELRDRIAALKVERDSVLKQPLPRDEAMERLDAAINARAATASIEQFVHEVTTGRPINVLAGFDHERIAWLLANTARPLLVAAVESHYATHTGLTSSDRTQKLSALAAEILDYEKQEESVCRAAEMAGGKIPRRADADPRAVMAPDSELPL
jgi:hypothetical protein